MPLPFALDHVNLWLIADGIGGLAEKYGLIPHVKHDDDLVIDGRNWRVIVGYGHAFEHAALYCDELVMLIPGDMLLPRITTNVSVWPMEPDGDPLDDFLSSLDGFRRLPSNTLVLPSHGLPFRGLHERIADLHYHHGRRFETIAAVCERATTAAQLPLLFKHKLDGYQLSFAMGETIAHLNSLVRRGVLKHMEGPDGIYRFVRGATLANCAGTI